jgi:hypothetical protein
MVVVALRGPRIRAPPNVIATLIRRHFNGLWRPPVVGAPSATHEGIGWWIMVVARICARACFSLVAYLFGYLRGVVASVLPAVVRVDVARGMRGNVVRVNVVRVLCLSFD